MLMDWYAILDDDPRYAKAFSAYDAAKKIKKRKKEELRRLRRTAIDSFNEADSTLSHFTYFIRKKKKNIFKKKKSMPAAKEFIKNAEAILRPIWGEVGSLPEP